MSSSEAPQWTIDELARETGMTVRNIRAHQSRGLLPPPEVRSRTGYYGPEHLARLRLIRDMQAEGFNLKAIERLIDTASETAGDHVLDFGRTLLTGFTDEDPEVWTDAELTARLGGPIDPKAMRKAQRLDLLRPLGEGRFEVPSPVLMRAGEELVSLGIPVSHVLAVAEQIDRHSRAIAEAFVRLFVEDVMGSGSAPASREDWARLVAVLKRVQPLATEAVRAGFALTMTRAVERQVDKRFARG